MRTDSEQSEANAIWAAVGNVKDPCLIGPEGDKPRRGTKHFRAGAMVYVIDAYWGTCDSVTVIGQHRKSRRFICIALPGKHLENLRAKLVYSPNVRRLVERHYGPDRALPGKEDVDRLCGITEWSKRKARPMGDTIWIDVQGRDKADLPADNSIILKLETQLRKLSDALKVARLTEFYGGKRWFLFEKWFDPSVALAAVKAIHEHLVNHPDDPGFEVTSSQAHWPAMLTNELLECQRVLGDAVAKGKKFRFLIVS